MEPNNGPVFQKNIGLSIPTSQDPSREDSDFHKVKKVSKINLNSLTKKDDGSAHNMVHNYLLHLQK